MVLELKTYTKAVLAILEKKCPDALAKFPSPDAFEFKINKRGDVDNAAIMVGHTVTQKGKKIQEVLWLEEYDSDKHTPFRERDNPGIAIGYAGPMDGYDAIYRPAHGAEARDDFKLQKLYMGIHYSTKNKGKVNSKINNANGFKGNDIFGTLSSHGCISCPFSRPMKALLRFILLHCGHATVYEEFVERNDKVQGITSLVTALKKMAKNAAAAEDVEDPELESESEEQDGELFVRDHGGRKRGRKEVGGAVATKKMRRES